MGPLGIDWDRQPLGDVDDAVLARKLGCDTETVRCARRRRGLKSARERKRDESLDRLVELRRKGWTLKKLGELFGVHHATVIRWLTLRGVA